MNLPLAFHPAVYHDVEEARKYYELRVTGLGDRFVAALESVYRRMEANPAMFGRVRKSVRFARLNKFPYAVYFQIEPDRIFVLSVQHNRRSQKVWQSRR
jgi:hypothetical protein